MNQDVAIEVQHISKSFKISYDKSKTLKDKIIFAKKDKYEIHQVLDDVSFTIEKGEAVDEQLNKLGLEQYAEMEVEI